MEDFSQPSDVAKRNNKVELASALRGSISFGRFLSESLDWEKWSAFSHNKLLEEAQTCSVPGSVAQMKAYFEAHYRRSASLKLHVEQEPINDMSNLGFSFTKTETKEPKIDDSSCTKVRSEKQKNQTHLKTPYKFCENHGLEKMNGDKVSTETEVEFDEKHSLKIQSSNRFQNNESKAIAHDSDCKKADKNAMKDVYSISHENENQNKKKSRISSSSISKIQKSMSKENKPPQNRMGICLKSSDRSEPTSGSLHMKISSYSVQKGQKSSLVNKFSFFNEKIGDSKATCSSSRPLQCTSSKASELYHSHIKTPTRAFTSGQKNSFSTPQLEYKRTQTYLHETSSSRRKVVAKFCPLSINCFESPSARENRRLFDRSVSSNSIAI